MDSSNTDNLDLIDAGTIKRYFGLLRHWAWLILLVALLGAGSAYLYSRLQTPVYHATARVLVIKPNNQNQSTDLTASLNVQQFTLTYVAFFKLSTVLDAVGKQLNIHLNANQVDATIVQNTQFIDVDVEATNPKQAAMIADALVQVVIDQSSTLQGGRYTSVEQSLDDQISQVEQQITATQQQLDNKPQDPLLGKSLGIYQQTYADLIKSREDIRLSRLENTPDIVQIGHAISVAKPIRPRTTTNTLLGGTAGLLVAAAAILMIDFLDDTLKNREDVKRWLGLNVIGFIAEINDKEDGLHVAVKSRSPISEAFRALRTNLEYLAVDQPIRSILVTSSAPGEGKTTVAANLAGILAQGGKKVLLIDADFRRPNVHKIAGINNRYGLSDLFRGQRKMEEVVQTFKGSNATEFSLITTGALPPNPAELLASERMRSILEEATKIADVVILDSPPSLVADAQVLGSRVDGVLFVLLTGETHREVAKSMLDTLRASNARILGAVLNRIKRQHIHYGGYGVMSYNYYGHYLSDGQPKEGSTDKKRSPFAFLKRKKQKE